MISIAVIFTLMQYYFGAAWEPISTRLVGYIWLIWYNTKRDHVIMIRPLCIFVVSIGVIGAQPS